jgi:hypothetical protein
MSDIELSPWQRILFGVAIAAGMTLVGYFAPGGGHLYPAVVTGIGSGLLLAVAFGGADALSKPVGPLAVLGVLMLAGGLAVTVIGIATLDGGTVLSGLVISAIGGGPMITRSLGRRRGADSTKDVDD